MHMLNPISIAIALLSLCAMPVRAEDAPVPMVSNQVAPIAASTRGSNAWRPFQVTPDIAHAIPGTARRRTHEDAADRRRRKNSGG
jgi:hypothetical protein